MNLSPAQREALRQINLAQIYGFNGIARWLLKEYLLAWPDSPLKSLYLRDYPQGEK
jgi:hypothetical protein